MSNERHCSVLPVVTATVLSCKRLGLVCCWPHRVGSGQTAQVIALFVYRQIVRSTHYVA